MQKYLDLENLIFTLIKELIKEIELETEKLFL